MIEVERKCPRYGRLQVAESAPGRCWWCGYYRHFWAVLGTYMLTGCAYPGGQVGSNAAYSYERTAEGGCIVTVYSGREQIDTASLVVTEDCRLEASAGNLASGSTSEALIRVIDRLVPTEAVPAGTGAQ